MPSASPARLACSEAWHLMQSLRRKKFLVSKSPTANRFEGMHLDKNVLHLGNSLNAERALQAMTAQELSLVKHVAIEWARCSYDTPAINLLTSNARGLRTIIFQDVDWETERLKPASAAALVAFYMTLSDSTAPEQLTGYIEDDLFWRGFLAEMNFPNATAIPRIHFVNPKQLLKLG